MNPVPGIVAPVESLNAASRRAHLAAETHLERLTSGDRARAIIIYCQADCWMSWNAVRRAAAYGYSAIYWLAEGTDGWRDWDGAFEDSTPVPLAAPVGAGR